MADQRIHPAPDLKSIPFLKYQRVMMQMHDEGLYDAATGWAPASRKRIQELLDDCEQLTIPFDEWV